MSFIDCLSTTVQHKYTLVVFVP